MNLSALKNFDLEYEMPAAYILDFIFTLKIRSQTTATIVQWFHSLQNNKDSENLNLVTCLSLACKLLEKDDVEDKISTAFISNITDLDSEILKKNEAKVLHDLFLNNYLSYQNLHELFDNYLLKQKNTKIESELQKYIRLIIDLVYYNWSEFKQNLKNGPQHLEKLLDACIYIGRYLHNKASPYTAGAREIQENSLKNYFPKSMKKSMSKVNLSADISKITCRIKSIINSNKRFYQGILYRYNQELEGLLNMMVDVEDKHCIRNNFFRKFQLSKNAVRSETKCLCKYCELARAVNINYRKKTFLGSGSFTKVHLFQSSKNKVARKKYISGDDNDCFVTSYLVRELFIIHRMIKNEGIIDLLGFDLSPNYAYLYLEYLPICLVDYLSEDKTKKEVISIMKGIVNGVCSLHSFGICHRDLKPGNIMLKPDGSGGYHVKLIDFNSAKFISPASRNTTLICTLYYRAPELLLKHSEYDLSIDIWSLGVIFVELFKKEDFLFSSSSSSENAILQLNKIFDIIGTPDTHHHETKMFYDNLYESVGCIFKSRKGTEFATLFDDTDFMPHNMMITIMDICKRAIDLHPIKRPSIFNIKEILGNL